MVSLREIKIWNHCKGQHFGKLHKTVFSASKTKNGTPAVKQMLDKIKFCGPLGYKEEGTSHLAFIKSS